MATTKNHKSISSQSTSATTTTKKARTPARQPPVVDRMTGGSPVTVPNTAPAATPPPASAAPAAPAAPASTAPAAGSGSSAGSSSVSAGAPVAAPPPVTLPSVPIGFVPVNPADLRGFRVLASQVAAVPDALAELQDFSNYTSLFGITAPDAVQLTERVTVAYEWTVQTSQTAAWYRYSQSQQGTAWKDALILLEALKPPFDLAATANPGLLSQYPAIARLLGAKTIVAKRAASSRARNKAAKAKVAASGSAGSASTQAPAAAGAAATPSGAANGTNAAAPTTTAAATPPRVVTIQN